MPEIFGNPPVDEFEFDGFKSMATDFRACADSLATESIGIVARAFIKNLNRPYRLAAMVPLACAHATFREHELCAGRAKLFNGDVDHPINSDVEFGAIVGILQTRRESMRPNDPNEATPISALWRTGLGVFNELLRSDSVPDPDNPVRDAAEVILSSAVLGTWTAFEVVVADLWIAALNERPRLGIRALGAEPESGDSAEDQKRKSKMQYNMSIPLLREFDYNVKNRMGTLLRNKWDFARRNEAKEAYLKTFRGKEARKSLEEILDDNNLGWLAALRNAITHNGSVADREFVQLMHGHPEMSKIKNGEPISLRGSLVRALMEAASRRGVELIKFVDNWLVNNIE